ncbi:MAG: hypothetical protein U5K56_04035 [Halioglobus sp.]|nr:hypothetical protein [Halioglobus sp.]
MLPTLPSTVGVDEIRRHLGEPQRAVLGGHAPPVVARLEHPARAGAVELAHGAARVHTDLIRRHMLAERVPIESQTAQGVGGGEDRHLQAPGMIARWIEQARLEAGGQLSRGFHVEFALRRQQERLLARDSYIDMRDGGTGHRPVRGNGRRQVPALDRETDGLGLAAHRQLLVPAHGVDIEMLAFDTPDQCVVQQVLLPIRGLLHPHEPRQRRAGALPRALCQCRPHGSGIGVVPRRTARGVYAAESHNHRQSLSRHLPPHLRTIFYRTQCTNCRAAASWESGHFLWYFDPPAGTQNPTPIRRSAKQ